MMDVVFGRTGYSVVSKPSYHWLSGVIHSLAGGGGRLSDLLPCFLIWAMEMRSYACEYLDSRRNSREPLNPGNCLEPDVAHAGSRAS